MPCTSSSTNHAGQPWACPGHPRLSCPLKRSKTWMPATSAGMTVEMRCHVSSRAPLPLGIWILLFPQRQPDRRAGQIEGLAQAVDQVALIVVGHRVGTAAEQDEARRPALGLGQVIEPDAPA